MSIIYNRRVRIEELPKRVEELDGNLNVTYYAGKPEFSHTYRCPWHGQDSDNLPESRTRECSAWCGWEVPFIETWYKDCVFESREKNYYDDSDFYAVVLDKRTGKVHTTEYDTTRFGGGGYCSIDATPEAIEAGRVWAEAETFRQLAYRDELDSQKIEMGRRVRVIKGKKAPIGTEGEIFYLNHVPDRYGRAWGGYTKLGLAITDRKETAMGKNGKQYERFADVAWTYADNCELIDPDSYRTSEVELREKAVRYARNMADRGGKFAALFAGGGLIFMG
jgi:hypothetical protein